MAFVDFAPVTHPVRSAIGRTFHAVAEWVTARRAEHAREAALRSLRFEPEHRLRDLGIDVELLTQARRLSRDELVQAMGIHRK